MALSKPSFLVTINTEKTEPYVARQTREIGGESVRFFIPDSLPPELDLMPFQRLLASANQALGRLGVCAS